MTSTITLPFSSVSHEEKISAVDATGTVGCFVSKS
jgi:hypothetical protein